eukprot:CAMPEP_0197453026 /NCGR_PEP_ID=MMETSP1175-20131217/33719_1 /TAXON_ID=1003142 /ORGANISM="Triceratium dubium, Strain CCMP147" /LENGTH=782 /DNA_ID=CAMNT_0042986189 /DNA_START=252 /DNA_END=2600 /DNA_ORIENTATION=+
MAPLDVDASNPCVPPSHPLVASVPPLPSAVRGEPIVIDAKCGRINADRPVLLYSNGRLVVVRELEGDVGGSSDGSGESKWKGGLSRPHGVKAFVYRGHMAQVTAAKFSPSGCYVASADARGHLRVWSYDNPEHLCKLELSSAMAGPVRDIGWDFESRRLCVAGEGSKTDSSSECARVIQWDTGVTCGELGQHTRNRAASCAFKPSRPMRIATGGGDDSRVLFNKGPPFVRVVDDKTMASEKCHERGAVNCLRYSPDGTKIASVGTDRSVVFYEGKTLELLGRMADVHTNSIYRCDWSSDSKYLVTCSADGSAKLIDMEAGSELQSWDILGEQRNRILGAKAAAMGGASSSLGDSASSLGSPAPKKKSATELITSPLGTTADRQGRSAQLRPDVGGMVMGCAFLAGDLPVAVCLNGEIAALPLPSGVGPSSSASASGGATAPKFLTGHQFPVSAMACDPVQPGRFYTGDTDGVMCAWELGQGGRSLAALGRIERVASESNDSGEESEGADVSLMNRVHTGAITSMTCIHNSGRGAVLSAGWDDAIRIGDGTKVRDKVEIEAQPNAIGRGTELVAVVTVKGVILMKDNTIVSDGIIDLPFQALSVDVSADDSTVVLGGENCNIYVYSVHPRSFDASAGQKELTLKQERVLEGGHLKPVHSVRLSSDHLASADVRDVCVWNIGDSYAPIIGKSRWCFHTQRIVCLAWSEDGSVLASGGNDDSIYLWSMTKKTKRVHYSFAHRGGISGLEFMKAGDGNGTMTLVSVGADGCINAWDVADDVAKKFG